MKVIRQTPEDLVLLHHARALCAALMLAALVLALFGLWTLAAQDWLRAGVAMATALALAAPALWLWADRVEVHFDARAERLSIDRRALTGPSHESCPLRDVLKAVVQEQKGPVNRTGAYRVALQLAPGTPAEARPLSTGYGGKAEAEALAARINGWLDSRATDSGS
jgi:hypothetical protein